MDLDSNNIEYTEMPEGETQSSHFHPPQSDTDNDTDDAPDADATTQQFSLSDENRRILGTVIDVIAVADCPVSVGTLQACTSLGDVGHAKLVIALGEGVACGLLNASSNKYAVVNDVRKRVSRTDLNIICILALLYSHVLSCLFLALPSFKVLLQTM